MVASDRQLGIIEYLSRQVGLVTARHLADRFRVSISTIERDLSDLRTAGHRISARPGRTGGLILEEPDSRTPSDGHISNRYDRFVGRRVELSKLVSARQNCLADNGGLALVYGKSGIGKTRLVREFGRISESAGSSTYWGRSIQNFAAPPFWPWIQVIKASKTDLPPGLADEAEHVVEMLMETVASPLRQTVQPDSANRFQLFHRLASFISKIPVQPLLIVLDDLQWADASSLNFMEFLNSTIGESPILLIGIYDNTTVTRRTPLRRMIGSLARSGNVVRVSLGPFSEPDANLMIESQSASSLPRELSRSIYERSEGNPFFIKEIVQHIVEMSGRKTAFGQDLDMTDEIPEGIRDALGRRLDDLSVSCIKLLEFASIVGKEFHLNTLDAIAESDESSFGEGVRSLLEEAIGSGLVEQSDNEGEFRFVHTLIHETVSDEIPLTRRAQMHAIVAATLERLYASHLDRHVEELARHYLAAVPVLGVDRAVTFSMLAGRRAMSKFSYEDAAVQYRNVLGLRTDQIGEEVHYEATGRLGQAMTRFATRSEKPKAVELVADAAAYFISTEQTNRAVDFSLTDIMPNAPGAGDETDICSMIERVIHRVPDSSHEHAMLLARYANSVISERLDLLSGRQSAEQAKTIGRKLEDPHVTLLADRALMAIEFRGLRQQPSFIPDCERMLRDALRLEDIETELRARWYMTSVLMSQGDLLRADQVAREFLLRAEMYQDANNLQQAMGMNANLAVRFGQWDRARSLAEINLNRFGDDSWALAAPNYIELSLGDQGAIGRLVDFVCDGPIRMANLRVAMAILVICNRPECITPQFVASAQLLSTRPQPETKNNQVITATLVLTGLIAALSGNDEIARKSYERLNDPKIPILQAVGVHPQRLLGKLASLLGDVDSALQHFSRGVNYYADNNCRPELAIGLVDSAEMGLILRRHSAEIVGLLDRAEPIASSLQMNALLDRISNVRSAAIEVVPVKPDYPDDLTGREVEVLILIAAGKTNRAIGDQLFISENTVTRHITNIFSKISVDNRTEATGYAYRNGLVNS